MKASIFANGEVVPGPIIDACNQIMRERERERERERLYPISN